MFTGIVECMGNIVRLVRRGGAMRLEVQVPGAVAETLKIGDSVSLNGTCVTVTDIEDDVFAADLVPETLGRTNLGTLQAGEEVNVERPLAANGRLDGHIVQGHVDVVGLVRSRRKVGAQELLEVNVPFELTRYLAPKGSVSVDGVSLTVVDVNKDRFRVALIPHTVATTTLGKKIQGQAVNVEVDILSKYVERHIAARMPQRAPSIAALVAHQDAEMRAAQPATPPPVSAPPVPQAPRSVPVARPTPPPRQQPPRYAGTAAPKRSVVAVASKTSKAPVKKAAKPPTKTPARKPAKAVKKTTSNKKKR